MTTTKPDAYARITATILEALENGTVPWRKTWNATGIAGAGHGPDAPRNYRGTFYRGINVFVLALTAAAKGYRHPVWITFKQARAAGGSVRKGQKGTQVVFWKILRKRNASTGDEDRFPLLRVYTVFNVEQCDGIDIPEHPEASDETADDAPRWTPDEIAEGDAAAAILNGYLEADGGPSFAELGDVACYMPSRDEIMVPPRDSFDSLPAFFSTAFHEAGHSTGHASRLKRSELADIARFGDHAYSREELVAEFTATFLMSAAGLERPDVLGNSAAYIDHWRQALTDDPKAVVLAAARAQKAAEWIQGRRDWQRAADESPVAEQAA